jgi:2-keto-4-pentenoate hydratase
MAMTRPFDPEEVARYIAASHANRTPYANLPDAFAVTTVSEAYRAQEALARLLASRAGRIAGAKIATTTKVMQQLMGIDHPCGGLLFENRIHASPTQVQLSDYLHLVIECELAVRLGRALPKQGAPYSADTVRAAIQSVMPAFELIEDRKADYQRTNAVTLIADNCWNAGVVLGPQTPYHPDQVLTGIRGALAINGRTAHEGMTDDPVAALAWVANLNAEHGRGLEPGMIVITGSVIATLGIAAGDTFDFRLDGFGNTQLRAT